MAQLGAKHRTQLGKKIREYKDRMFPERGSGKKLAELLGISPQLLSNWMHGSKEPTPVQLAELAELFNTSIQELCSLPRIKRKASGLDIIVDITKYRNSAKMKRIRSKVEQQRVKDIKDIIINNLKDFM